MCNNLRIINMLDLQYIDKNSQSYGYKITHPTN